MKFANLPRLRQRIRAACRITVLGAAAVYAGYGLAQSLDPLADAPLFTASGTSIKPNIMFILDDSGSMQWDFMPDAADVLNRNHYGRTSAQCNGLAYDPTTTYAAPVDMDTSSPPALVSKGDADITAWTTANPATQTVDQQTVRSFSTAPVVGSSLYVYLNGTGMFFQDPQDTVTVFRNSTNYFVGQVTGVGNDNGTVLGIKVVAIVGSMGKSDATSSTLGKGEPVTGEYYKYKGTQPKLAWYKASGSVDSGSTFYSECMTGVSTTSTKFEKVIVSALDSKGKQNYANWAKYYRTRMATMQSASSIAFQGLGDRYRIGYSTIGQPSAKSGVEDFVHIDDFAPAQKKSFYTQLHAAKPGNTGTPLRGALSKAGKYFANKATDQDKDPIQYSCQRNYAILSTDGYWNTGGSRASEGSTAGFGAYGLDNKLVGNVDNTLPRPMADGDTQKTTTTETWSVVRDGRWQKVTGSQQVVTKKNVASATGIIEVQSRTREYSTSDQCGKSGGTRYYRRYSQPQTNEVTAKQTRTITETTKTPTTTTTITTRKQATDYTRVVVIEDGQVKSDVTTDTPGAATVTDEVVGAPVVGAPVKTTATTYTATSRDDDNWTSGSSSYVGCERWGADSYSSTVTTPKTLAFGAGTNSSSTTTETLTTTEGWIGSPTEAKTEVLSSSEFLSTNGVSNSLADVAAYYYENDLRNSALSNCTNGSGKDVCEDNVPGTALKDPYKSFGDSQRKQHMTTFTLGMGVSGSLKFDPRYQTLRSGDFHDIVNLARNWPNTTSGQNTTVDDLWHAAVNGRGQYFSAGNPSALTAGLNAALAAIDTVIGSASAASTSSLQPVEGDNDIFVAQFTTKEWTGDVLAYKIDPNNGDISKTHTWSAKDKLESKGPDARRILYRSPLQSKLVEFTEANLGTDSMSGMFTNFCSNPKASAAETGGPQQCATMVDTDKAKANLAANLVNYLRGDQTMAFYRTRTARLGDIINASPLFVGKPGFKYTENNYADFVTSKKDRTSVVLAAANDGMVHAFARDTGVELWAFIPSFVMENLPKLADEAFQNFHHYFVDGSPQIGDVYDPVAKTWKTIVVGGLNKGGRGYYALDVTDPENPEIMWEFSHPNLGYTFGNPIITKRKSGEWVVVFGSGYENGGTGDGNGHLFVLDALTGKEVPVFGRVSVDPAGGIPTLNAAGKEVGTPTAPSGLAKINVWIDSELNNTAIRFYGGDELGNLWRFDIDGNVEPKGKAFLMAELQLPVGTPQPITTKPILAEIEYNGTPYPVVFAATGRYLRDGDSKNTGVQTVYAIKEPLAELPYGDVRNGTLKDKFVVQTISAGLDAKKNPTRTTTSKSVDWNAMSGWRADFPVGGERVSVNPQLALDTLFIGSNLPKDEDCSVGGDSFLYQFNILTGQATSVYVGNVLLQGLTLVQLTKGSAAGSIETIITRSDGKLQKEIGDPPAVTGSLRRTSWREIVE